MKKAYTKDEAKELIARKAKESDKPVKYSIVYIKRVIRYYIRLMSWLYQMGKNTSTRYLLESLKRCGEEKISTKQLETYRKYYDGDLKTLEAKVQEIKESEIRDLNDILKCSSKMNVQQYLDLVDSSGRAGENNLFDKKGRSKTDTKVNLYYVQKTICTFYSKRALSARERRKEARNLIKDTLSKFYSVIDPDFDSSTKEMDTELLNKIFTDEDVDRIADIIFLKINYFELQEVEEYVLYDWIERRIEKVITFRFIEDVFLDNKAKMQAAQKAKMQAAQKAKIQPAC